MKKLMSALTLLTCVVFASTSFAAWDTCKVKRIGSIGTSTTSIKVDNCKGGSANNGKWLAIVNQVDRQMAVTLTARSLQAYIKVDADFASATTNGSTLGAISTIYLEEE